MVIVDADVHVSATKRGDIDITIDDVIRLLDENGVDKAVVQPMLTYTRHVSEDNAAIADGEKRYPNRLIGFGGLNPRLGTKQTFDELKKCVEEYGFKGVKMNGARDLYIIDDREFTYPFIEKVSQNGLILALHSGSNDPIRTHPWRIGNIARDFPELRILMIHMGGVGNPGLYDSAIRIAERFPNIWLIGSEVYDYRAIERAIRAIGAKRLCYGSDAPFSMIKVTLAIYNAILKDLPSPWRDLVMGENILQLVS